VTKLWYEGAVQRLQELSLPSDQITVAWVPGSVEIPLIAQQFAKSRDFDAIIALGAVIRGETGHYDYVCEQVSQGCQKVAMEYDIPVIFGVLTTENKVQALDRVGGNHGHKGRESADAAFQMVSLMKSLETAELIDE